MTQGKSKTVTAVATAVLYFIQTKQSLAVGEMI
jgi:hypothetical protein